MIPVVVGVLVAFVILGVALVIIFRSRPEVHLGTPSSAHDAATISYVEAITAPPETPPGMHDAGNRLYLSLKGAREKLCIAQGELGRLGGDRSLRSADNASHLYELQSAIDTIGRVGTFWCPQWSRFDEPPMPGESE